MLAKLSSVALALWASSAVAAPTPNGPSTSPKCSSQYFDANFDDIPGVTITDTAIPTGYKGLYFQNIDAIQALGLLNTPGLIAHSPKAIGIAVRRNQLTGGNFLITSNFQSSKTTSFSLSSLYYGCTESNGPQGASSIPVSCSMTLTGYQGADQSINNAKEVCAQTFTYNPTSMLNGQNLAPTGQLASCFQNLQFVQFTYSLTGVLAAGDVDSVLAFDDITGSTTQCS